jgi:cytoskeletal protein RodZ
MGEFSAFVIISFLISYFIPSIIALFRAKSNTFAIILLNLFLGWTFIGWVVALVWAATKDKPTQNIVVNNSYNENKNNEFKPKKSNSAKTINSMYEKNNSTSHIMSHQEKIDSLEKLKKMLDTGILTQEEFEKQKTKILE